MDGTLDRALGATPCYLLLPRSAGEQDEVLVELEPDAVVAVDAGRCNVPMIAARRLRDRAAEADAVGGEARIGRFEWGEPANSVVVERTEAIQDGSVVIGVQVVVEGLGVAHLPSRDRVFHPAIKIEEGIESRRRGLGTPRLPLGFEQLPGANLS